MPTRTTISSRMAFYAVLATGLQYAAANAAPITIDGIQQLDQIGIDPSLQLSGDYVLGTNIDATDFNFMPIGSLSAPFTGSLDGKGFTIRNLNISSGSDGAGLFGSIGNSGSVANLSLLNESIISKFSTNVGGVAGTNYGTIANVSAHSVDINGGLNFSSSAGTNVGGVAGDNFGSITSSRVTGTISNGANVGGVVGKNEVTGTISLSSANVTVKNPQNGGAGGLAGGNEGNISQSFAAGTVSASEEAIGGLVGYNDGGSRISQSYSNASVTLNGNLVSAAVGALVGENSGIIDQTYATGAVSLLS